MKVELYGSDHPGRHLITLYRARCEFPGGQGFEDAVVKHAARVTFNDCDIADPALIIDQELDPHGARDVESAGLERVGRFKFEDCQGQLVDFALFVTSPDRGGYRGRRVDCDAAHKFGVDREI